MIFSKEDIEQITQRGMTLDQVLQQLETFNNGIPYVDVVAAATTANGILKLSKAAEKACVLRFEKARNGFDMLKFVPASGAASRMFKSLFEFMDEFNPENESFNSYLNRKKTSEIPTFFKALERFPFYDVVIKHVSDNYPEYKNLPYSHQNYLFVKTVLDSEVLNYGEHPKALLPFHRYETHVATAFEEQLSEAALYSASGNTARLHFTLTAQHLQHFRETLSEIKARVAKHKDMQFSITFSYQKQHTDTLAVNLDNTPFRDENNRLIFRPSGHGALLENLNAQDADLIFIKNIDNVAVVSYAEEISFYKKVLAGKLLTLQERIFTYAKALDAASPSQTEIESITQFLTTALHIALPSEFKAYPKAMQLQYLREKLHRPIRVCGMVKDEGEPGGGPFWVKDKEGNSSLQIVEAAQINGTDSTQKNIMKTTTHFNPVDIVCGIKNYKGEKYNLLDFADPEQGFITQKSEGGKTIKAIEAPGLWNGAMAHWNSVFVEVPRITFNPVKTVNDLLKPTHQVS